MARIDVTVPSYGMTDSDSYVREWLVTAGTTVSAGTPILALETAKADTEVEAPVDGVLGEHLVAADSEVPPGTVLTWIEQS